MNDLDDLDLLRSIDPTDYLGAVETLPEQASDALVRAGASALPDLDGVRSVCVLGMGGSGISGDVLGVALQGSSVPVATAKGYRIPAWVDPDTLVFAVSYSGETEETLEAFEEALKAGARIVVVSTGGTLAKLAGEHGIPAIEVPKGLQPRAALAYLSLPLVWVCDRAGLAAGASDAVSETIGRLATRSQELSRGIPGDANPAKQLARRLNGRIPIIYGTDPLGEVAAYRWKCQLNECAKVPAWHHSFPELDHNEIVGWGGMSDLTKEAIALIVLRHSGEHPRVARRVEITVSLIEDSVAFVREATGRGDSSLARLFDLIYFGDFVATYLAAARGVDPAPVEVIQQLKRELAVG